MAISHYLLFSNVVAETGAPADFGLGGDLQSTDYLDGGVAVRHIENARQGIWRFATGIGRRLRSFFAWLGHIAEPVSKWATTLGTVGIIGGAVFAYYQFVVAGASDWAINLSLSTEVIPYHDNLGLLVIHVRTKNPRNSEVDVEPPQDMFTLEVKRVPDGKPNGSVINPEDDGLPKDQIVTINLLPKDGYVFAPGADFEDVRSVVVPLGSKVLLSVKLTYSDDYVAVGNVVVVTPSSSNAFAIGQLAH